LKNSFLFVKGELGEAAELDKRAWARPSRGSAAAVPRVFGPLPVWGLFYDEGDLEIFVPSGCAMYRRLPGDVKVLHGTGRSGCVDAGDTRDSSSL